MVNTGTLTLTHALISGNYDAFTYDPSEVRTTGSPATIVANNYNLFGHDGNAAVVGFSPVSPTSCRAKALAPFSTPRSPTTAGRRGPMPWSPAARPLMPARMMLTVRRPTSAGSDAREGRLATSAPSRHANGNDTGFGNVGYDRLFENRGTTSSREAKTSAAVDWVMTSCSVEPVRTSSSAESGTTPRGVRLRPL